MEACYLLIAHGSREVQANRSFFSLVERFRKAYPARHVEGCFLELGNPLIPEAIEKAISKGVQEFFLLPLMFFSGKHVREGIPQMIKEARAKHPDVHFHFTNPLGNHPLLIKLLDQKIKEMKKNGS